MTKITKQDILNLPKLVQHTTVSETPIPPSSEQLKKQKIVKALRSQTRLILFLDEFRYMEKPNGQDERS